MEKGYYRLPIAEKVTAGTDLFRINIFENQLVNIFDLYAAGVDAINATRRI